ncbi:D-glycero-beta-D-manno-heptose 1,7-bisphosphate 7-phosphatase [Nitratiruptor sp. YY09-18]|uniref:D-glycero-beta-D-manno-heptose 1,7-bisphosphate 7-phosphatase n=1 Tax=Nitratiruptor sp. YY09-18 TaxID=2724901 RepID=UPI001937BBD7|nr:D-glycero-beta-D-manno-heptose 1,7-bisphosphate 7-phosphatase [Nitratiruptor sp. YY09-18]BCD67616.1 D-glycero-D-manno-heptose 1,7-bisphosphate phosphatase [Nitratiruptor sp. YY09-18]
MHKAVFLDRDGVINVDKGYVGNIENFEFIDGVLESLRRLQQRGFKLIIITNQSGIGRGYYTLKDFQKLTKFMLQNLRDEGITIDGVYFCPHHPDEKCSCRKPAPGMIMQAAKEHEIDLSSSWLIGDKMSDIEAAKNAGIPNTILLQNKRLIDVVQEIV